MTWIRLVRQTPAWREMAVWIGFLNGHRLRRLSQVLSAQTLVQIVGFATGLLLVRHMAPEDFGWFTLAIGLATLAAGVSELGLSSAVMAVGGRSFDRPQALGSVLADAHVLHTRLAKWAGVVVLPAVAVLFLRHDASVTLAVAAMCFAALLAWTQVRVGMALSVLRLQGAVVFQQLVDLALNLGRLSVLGLLTLTWGIGLPAALGVHLVAAGLLLLTLQAGLQRRLGLPSPPQGEHASGLRAVVRRQAPNSLWFAFSGQITLWLVGVFGNAQNLAEVGALGRLAGAFSLIGMLVASLAVPYFARPHSARELRSGLRLINSSFLLLLVLLQVVVQGWPASVLWLLGPNYAGLGRELSWMVAAGTCGAWAGAVYSMGCARGWVLPVSWSVVTGVLSTVVAASLVDLSTVSGGYMVNTAVGATGAVVAIGYVLVQLRRLALSEREAPST